MCNFTCQTGIIHENVFGLNLNKDVMNFDYCHSEPTLSINNHANLSIICNRSSINISNSCYENQLGDDEIESISKCNFSLPYNFNECHSMNSALLCFDNCYSNVSNEKVCQLNFDKNVLSFDESHSFCSSMSYQPCFECVRNQLAACHCDSASGRSDEPRVSCKQNNSKNLVFKQKETNTGGSSLLGTRARAVICVSQPEERLSHVSMTDLQLTHINEGHGCQSQRNSCIEVKVMNFNEGQESLFGAPDSDTGDSDEDSVSSADIEANIADNENEKKSFSFLHFNVEGLGSKLYDKEFVSFINSFNFICLVETFLMGEIPFNIFSYYKAFYSPAVKLSARGRPSGGVCCLIRKEVLPFVKQIKVDTGNVLMFILDKSLFDLPKDVLYVCSYVPPEGSGYYRHQGLENDGISVLENCLVDNVLIDNDVFVLLSGDLNARTSDISQPITLENEFFDHLHTDEICRKSQDSVFNNFGKTLLHMCTSLNLSILNGVCHGDPEGHYTYICDAGCSVVDYFLMSNTLFALLFDKIEMKIGDSLYCKHMPISLSVIFPKENDCIPENNDKEYSIEKFIWNDEKLDVFENAFVSDNIKALLNDAINTVNIDINLALSKFNDCIREAAKCMKKTVKLNVNKQLDWFDLECKNKRKEVRKYLKKFKKYKSDENRHNFCVCRREYKHLLHRKKREFNDSMIQKLVNAIHDQKYFWESLYKICPKRVYVKMILK